ncbi:LacI family transcriptional regulator, partial [Pseudomonas aeruginosa]
NEFLPQPITTIVQPTSQIAYTSVKELFKIIEKEKYKEVTSFDAKLFVGATTARLRDV